MEVAPPRRRDAELDTAPDTWLGFAGSIPATSIATEHSQPPGMEKRWVPERGRLLNVKWLLTGNGKVTKGHPFVRVSFLIHKTVFGLSFNLHNFRDWRR